MSEGMVGQTNQQKYESIHEGRTPSMHSRNLGSTAHNWASVSRSVTTYHRVLVSDAHDASWAWHNVKVDDLEGCQCGLSRLQLLVALLISSPHLIQGGSHLFHLLLSPLVILQKRISQLVLLLIVSHDSRRQVANRQVSGMPHPGAKPTTVTLPTPSSCDRRV